MPEIAATPGSSYTISSVTGAETERVTLLDSLGLVATLRVNAGGAGVGQTLKTYTGTVNVATGATVPLETVTAGKTFYITDIYVGSNSATVFSVTVNANATPIFNAFCKGDTGPISLAGIETQPSATSGAVVAVVFGAAAATTAAYMFSGYEQ